MSMVNDKFRSGFITLIGRPNSGKSTLLNTIMGKKIAITSNTAQTTRHRFRAIKTSDDYQLIIVDTPGIHKPHDVLGEDLNQSAFKALEDVDVVVMLIDASAPLGRGDEWIISHLKSIKVPCIALISKNDLVDKDALELQYQKLKACHTWDAIMDCSSLEEKGIDEFVQNIVSYLPYGPKWFPDDIECDQGLDVLVAEYIREKILRSFHDEIPHAIGTQTEELKYIKSKDIYVINAIIYVEQQSQKGMIIGKKGSAIKRIGIESRRDLEHFLGCPVFLDLNVKVKKNWRKDANQIRRFGYGQGI